MQYQAPGAAPAAALGVGVPLYAPTPLLQPAHPTPFYIEDILGRGPAAAPAPHSLPAPPPPTLPSPNSSFTSLVAPYRTPVYEPTPIHPAFSHHLAATYGTGAYAGPLYSFPRAVGDYTHALIRQDPLGKPRPPRRPSPGPCPVPSRSLPCRRRGSGGARPPVPSAPARFTVNSGQLRVGSETAVRGRGDSDLFSFNRAPLRVSLVMSRVVLVGSFNCAERSRGRSRPFPADGSQRRPHRPRSRPRGSRVGAGGGRSVPVRGPRCPQ